MQKPTVREKMKHVLFYIAMTALTLGFCYIVLEFVVAKFYYSNVYITTTIAFDERLGWRLRPGTYWTKAPNTFGKHRIYINGYNLRNRDIAGTTGPDTTRIIILGDSFVFGKAVAEQQIFVRRLEALLNEDSDGRTYEVVNAGVPGYGTAQELLFMRDLAERGVRGDIYLLVVFTNDILDNLRRFSSTLEENAPQPGFVLTDGDSLVLKYMPQKKYLKEDQDIPEPTRTLGRTKIGAVLKTRMESFLQTKPRLLRTLIRLGINVEFPRVPGLLNAWYRDDILEKGIPLMQRIIGEIRNEADRNGAKLLVGFIPSQLQVYQESYESFLRKTFPDNEQVPEWLEDNTKPQRSIERMCHELDLPFCDLYPALYGNNKSSLYIPRDGHLNARGHKIVARELTGFVRKQAP
jgi:lysophospholipase L1-like esterase